MSTDIMDQKVISFYQWFCSVQIIVQARDFGSFSIFFCLLWLRNLFQLIEEWGLGSDNLFLQRNELTDEFISLFYSPQCT